MLFGYFFDFQCGVKMFLSRLQTHNHTKGFRCLGFLNAGEALLEDFRGPVALLGPQPLSYSARSR